VVAFLARHARMPGSIWPRRVFAPEPGRQAWYGEGLAVYRRLRPALSALDV
jgi:hypothetical protein